VLWVHFTKLSSNPFSGNNSSAPRLESNDDINMLRKVIDLFFGQLHGTGLVFEFIGSNDLTIFAIITSTGLAVCACISHFDYFMIVKVI
jgi:hypothetical protein